MFVFGKNVIALFEEIEVLLPFLKTCQPCDTGIMETETGNIIRISSFPFCSVLNEVLSVLFGFVLIDG